MNYIVTKRKDYFHKIGKYNFKETDEIVLPRKIALDLECTGLTARIDSIFAAQIGTGKDNYLFDLETVPFKELRQLIEDKILVLHNAAFDLGFLYRKGFFPKKIRDTMLASMILHNGRKEENGGPVLHSWKACMKRELGIEYDKSEQKNIHKIKLSTKESINYCFQDVDRLLELEENLEAKLDEWGALETLYLHYDHVQALAYMEQCGLPVSSERWLAKMRADIAEKDAKARMVIDYIYDNLPQFRNLQLNAFETEKELNVLLSSPQQMIPVFEQFGINVLDEEDNKSLEKDIIKRSNHPFAKMWVDYKEIEHDITTFGKKLYEKIEDERIYTRFHPILDTGRISTRKGEINFLNFPANEKTRSCFYTEKNLIVGADFSNQETYILADQSKDEMTLASVIDGIDLHLEFAKKLNPEIADLSNEEILKKHKDKRQAAKAPRFALIASAVIL